MSRCSHGFTSVPMSPCRALLNCVLPLKQQPPEEDALCSVTGGASCT